MSGSRRSVRTNTHVCTAAGCERVKVHVQHVGPGDVGGSQQHHVLALAAVRGVAAVDLRACVAMCTDRGRCVNMINMTHGRTVAVRAGCQRLNMCVQQGGHWGGWWRPAPPHAAACRSQLLPCIKCAAWQVWCKARGVAFVCRHVRPCCVHCGQ